MDRCYDLKLVKAGHTRVMSVGRIVPREWKIVRVTVLEQSQDKVRVDIERLGDWPAPPSPR